MDIGRFTQDWADMPESETFDNLIAATGYHNYAERNGRWYIIMRNGVYYRQSARNSEIGEKCGPLDVLDKVFL